MESMKLASGDNNTSLSGSPRFKSGNSTNEQQDNAIDNIEQQEFALCSTKITPEAIDDNEIKLKDRISQCRNVIESLRFELTEEKAKLEKEISQQQSSRQHPEIPSIASPYNYATSEELFGDYAFNSSAYSACVDNKLNCDENLLEYEKQLEKYQITLNKAQIEKKNAIRKQMLTKAFRLKLLEVENQCNIELLRVKQSLQCLEPLQMIAEKWKNEPHDTSYDLNKFELMPRFPEPIASPGIELAALKRQLDNADVSGIKDDSTLTRSD